MYILHPRGHFKEEELLVSLIAIPMVCISDKVNLGIYFAIHLSESYTVEVSAQSHLVLQRQCKQAGERTWQDSKSQIMLMDCTPFDVWVYLDSFFFFTQGSQWTQCSFGMCTLFYQPEELWRYWTFNPTMQSFGSKTLGIYCGGYLDKWDGHCKFCWQLG